MVERKSVLVRIFPVLLLVLYFASPLLLTEYFRYLLLIMSIMVIVAQGLNVMIGFARLISFGQPGFMAIGAYAGAILATRIPWIPFPATILIGGAAAALMGLLIGFPCLRLDGMYLAMATFGFSAAAFELINYLKPLTGGNEGMYAPAPAIFGVHLTSTSAIFYITAVCVVLTLLLVKNLSMSRTGRAWNAIRDDQIAASSMGINLRREKLKAFSFAAFLAGVAGVLYSYAIRYLESSYFNLMGLSLFLILVMGGIGRVYGPVYGSIIMTLLPQVLGGRFSQSMSLVYGIVLVLFILLAPMGVYGFWYRIRGVTVRGFNVRDALMNAVTPRHRRDGDDE